MPLWLNHFCRHVYLSVVVPYRNRLEHLRQFAPYIIQVFDGIPFRLLVLEQADNNLFNRGRLCNIGFSVAGDTSQVVCFHDVDMMPLDGAKIYLEITQTTHLAGQAEQNQFELPYPEYFGGVQAVTKSDFTSVNGYSNEYWGWGEEDDDLWLRYQMAGLPVKRRPGRFASLPHVKAHHPKANVQRFSKTMAEATRHCADPKLLARIGEVLEEIGPNGDPIPSDSDADGLSTLSYCLLDDMSLTALIPLAGADADHHRLIRVTFDA